MVVSERESYRGIKMDPSLSILLYELSVSVKENLIISKIIII